MHLGAPVERKKVCMGINQNGTWIDPKALRQIEQGMNMKSFSRGMATISLLLMSTISTSAQNGDFSADMRLSDGAGRTQTLKLFVGNKRARFDLPKQGNDSSGIGSILIDFDHQFIYLLVPQNKLYLQIEGSA